MYINAIIMVNLIGNSYVKNVFFISYKILKLLCT